MELRLGGRGDVGTDSGMALSGHAAHIVFKVPAVPCCLDWVVTGSVALSACHLCLLVCVCVTAVV